MSPNRQSPKARQPENRFRIFPSARLRRSVAPTHQAPPGPTPTSDPDALRGPLRGPCGLARRDPDGPRDASVPASSTPLHLYAGQRPTPTLPATPNEPTGRTACVRQGSRHAGARPLGPTPEPP